MYLKKKENNIGKYTYKFKDILTVRSSHSKYK